MSQSPLAIESYFFRRVSFEVRAEPGSADAGASAGWPEVNITTTIGRHSEDARRFRIDLHVESHKADEASPFVFDLDLVGFFRVLEGFPDEQVEALARINGSSILYAAAREYIAAATARSGYPPVLLQSVSFVSIPEAEDADKKPRRTSTKKSSPKRRQTKKA